MPPHLQCIWTRVDVIICQFLPVNTHWILKHIHWPLSWCGSIHTAVMITIMSTIPNPHWHCYLCGFGTGITTEEILPEKNHTQVFTFHLLEALWEMFDSMLWQISLFLSGLHWKVFSLPTCLVGSSQVPLFHVFQTVPVWAQQAELFMLVLAELLQPWTHRGFEIHKELCDCAGVINSSCVVRLQSI